MVKAPVGGARHHTLLLPSCSILALVAIGLPSQADAAGTRAGTTISNTASASFDNGAGTQSIDSNTVDMKVDELLDVVVAGQATDVPTTPGATNQVLTYRVTNTGNGAEAFALSTIANVGGDNYDPAVTQIYIDANNNDTYDAGTDTLYVAGSETPLQPDTAMTVFVLATTPGSVADGNRGIVTLVAAAKTGTGTPGNAFAGQGEGGGDAIVGTTGADGQDNGNFLVSAATVSLAKSATITDPFGGSEPVPGAIITYTITATVAGSGSVSGLAITDNVPADTAYVTGSITLGGSGLTDAADADAGDYNGTRVRVDLGTVAGGQTRTVTFRTRIN